MKINMFIECIKALTICLDHALHDSVLDVN